MLYLVHLSEPYWHAKHYLGFINRPDGLTSRLAYHRAGNGSRLLRAVTKAGISFTVVRTWEGGTRTDERRLKGHSSTRLCPICSGEGAWARGLLGNQSICREILVPSFEIK